jgi:hypothetical protein
MRSGDFTVGSKCIPWEIWQLQRRTFLFGLCWQGYNDRVISIGLANFAGTARGTNFNEEFSIDFAKLLPLRRNIIFIVDGLNRANRLACATVNALIRLDIKHSRTFIDAVNRAFFDTGLIFNINTRFGNYVRHEESSIWIATAVNCNTCRGLSRLLTTVVLLTPFGEASFA